MSCNRPHFRPAPVIPEERPCPRWRIRKTTCPPRCRCPPATWQALDGSKITGKQLAVSPSGEGNILLQFVQANLGAQQIVKSQADCIFWKTA